MLAALLPSELDKTISSQLGPIQLCSLEQHFFCSILNTVHKALNCHPLVVQGHGVAPGMELQVTLVGLRHGQALPWVGSDVH